MKREKKAGECRFCGKSIMRGEFQDTHYDGKLVCINCYIYLNDTFEKIQKYWLRYHYVVRRKYLA
jgi:hypothetical protein